MQETITTHGGELVELDKWGRKRLAYPIKKLKAVTMLFSDSALQLIWLQHLNVITDWMKTL